jgi:hypothetical protein
MGAVIPLVSEVALDERHDLADAEAASALLVTRTVRQRRASVAGAAAAGVVTSAAAIMVASFAIVPTLDQIDFRMVCVGLDRGHPLVRDCQCDNTDHRRAIC